MAALKLGSVALGRSASATNETLDDECGEVVCPRGQIARDLYTQIKN
jgi:hypothetical protein